LRPEPVFLGILAVLSLFESFFNPISEPPAIVTGPEWLGMFSSSMTFMMTKEKVFFLKVLRK